MQVLIIFKRSSKNKCTNNWKDLDFKRVTKLKSYKTKKNHHISSLIYRNQAEFIKLHCANNDPIHMSAHNGLVVQIILTSEAKTFKAWMLFKSVTYVLTGSLHNSFIVLSNGCKVFKILKLTVCMCCSYLIKSMTQSSTLQGALRPCPYVPCSVLSQSNKCPLNVKTWPASQYCSLGWPCTYSSKFR